MPPAIPRSAARSRARPGRSRGRPGPRSARAAAPGRPSHPARAGADTTRVPAQPPAAASAAGQRKALQNRRKAGRKTREAPGSRDRLQTSVLLPGASSHTRQRHAAHTHRIIEAQVTPPVALSPWCWPRKGKTAWLARMILRFPGALVCTSVKDDLFRYTSGIREKSGRIHVFNPEGIGGVPSTFAINPVAGCEVKAVAIRRAQSLCNATDTSNMKDADFFKAKAAQMLEAMLYAAALLHSDLRLIARWVFTSAEEAQKVLFADNSSEMAAALNELHNSPAEKTAGTIRMVLSQVLGFLTDPALAMSVLPAGDGGFDIDEFIGSRGTLYMIASGDHETS